MASERYNSSALIWSCIALEILILYFGYLLLIACCQVTGDCNFFNSRYCNVQYPLGRDPFQGHRISGDVGEINILDQ